MVRGTRSSLDKRRRRPAVLMEVRGELIERREGERDGLALVARSAVVGAGVGVGVRGRDGDDGDVCHVDIGGVHRAWEGRVKRRAVVRVHLMDERDVGGGEEEHREEEEEEVDRVGGETHFGEEARRA